MRIVFRSGYEGVDKDEWEKFVLEHPDGNIFQTYRIITFYEQIPEYRPVIVFALHEDSILGVMAGVIINSTNNLLRYFTSRCIVTGGPLSAGNNLLISEGLVKEFTKEVKNRTIYIQIRNLCNSSALKDIFRKNRYKFEEHLDIHINLTEPFELLLKKMHESRRRNLSKAFKKGVKVRRVYSEKEIMDGFRLVAGTYKKVKLPSPPDGLFIALARKLVREDSAICYGIFYDDKMIGFRTVLTWRKTIYDYYAGSLPGESNKYPNDVLIIEILREGCENNFDLFIFGGAGKPDKKYGVRDHKLKFGGSVVNYGRYTRINNPAVYWPLALTFQLFRHISRLL